MHAEHTRHILHTRLQPQSSTPIIRSYPQKCNWGLSIGSAAGKDWTQHVSPQLKLTPNVWLGISKAVSHFPEHESAMSDSSGLEWLRHSSWLCVVSTKGPLHYVRNEHTSYCSWLPVCATQQKTYVHLFVSSAQRFRGAALTKISWGSRPNTLCRL